MHAVPVCITLVVYLFLLRGAGPRLRRQSCNAHVYALSVERHLRLSAHWASYSSRMWHAPWGVAVTGAVACCCDLHARLLLLYGLCCWNGRLDVADTRCSPHRGRLQALAACSACPNTCSCMVRMASATAKPQPVYAYERSPLQSVAMNKDMPIAPAA